MRLLFALAAACALASGVSAGQNLLVNGSFEDGLTGWELYKPGQWGGPMQAVPTTAPGDIGLCNPGSTPDGRSVLTFQANEFIFFEYYMEQTIPTITQGIYRLSGYMAGGYSDPDNTGDFHPGGLKIGAGPGGGIAYYSIYANETEARYASDWTYGSVDWIATSPTMSVSLYWGAYASYNPSHLTWEYSAYFDDIRIEMIGIVAPEPSSLLTLCSTVVGAMTLASRRRHTGK